MSNPFIIHGVVKGDHFTNRKEEIGRIAHVLGDPGSKLLVYGPRRMGKTSTILNAIDAVNIKGGHAFLADLSTASTAVDMGNRILAAASKILGRKWRNLITDIVSRLNITVTLTPDTSTGIPVPSVDLHLRGDDTTKQRQTLSAVLDSINQSAQAHGITIGIALDEFQEIHKFGGETAEWDLRAAIQQHAHIGYILSGSREHLIERMLKSDGALYKMVDKMPFGPISREHLANWIDNRMTAAGVEAASIGNLIVQRSGPRTRDIVQVARRCYDRTSSKGKVDLFDVEKAFEDIVAEEQDLLYESWRSYTAHQQNVLRAVAASPRGLTTKETLSKFSLGSSGTTANTAAYLVKAGCLIRQDPYTRKTVATPTGYDFDSPFFKDWVIRNTLSDLGFP